MATIIIKPTDANAPNYAADLAVYESHIDGVRKLASPNLVEPITADDLPTEILGNDVFLRSAERQVIRHAGLTTSEVASLPIDSEKFAILLTMVQLRLAINISPRLPELLRESVLSYAHDEQWEQIGWKVRQEELQEEDTEELLEINPDADVLQSLPMPKVLLTDSRLG